MRPFFAMLVTFAVTGQVFADDKKPDTSDRAQVTKFLKDHIIDKKIVSPKKTYKLDEGRLEVDHEDVTTFNNFTESANGFSFDMTIAKKYIRYDMGEDGTRVQPGTDRSSTDVYRYEIAERRSTKMLTGNCRAHPPSRMVGLSPVRTPARVPVAPGRRQSPKTFTSTRFGRLPSNSP